MKAIEAAVANWRKEHTRICPRQVGPEITLADGKKMMFCPGYEEHYHETVGWKNKSARVRCLGCHLVKKFP